MPAGAVKVTGEPLTLTVVKPPRYPSKLVVLALTGVSHVPGSEPLVGTANSTFVVVGSVILTSYLEPSSQRLPQAL